ncbi:MAG: HEAT repeat domain-containing protein [Kofleriaceae bacterium]
MTVPRRSAMFDIRPGEGRRLLGVGAAMAAILAAHTVAETARDAMFLRAVPSTWLSVVYGALAVLAIGALVANAALIRRVGRRHALVSTLMAASYGTTMFFLLRPGPAVAFAFYLWIGLLGTVTIVQFWLLASSTFTSSEAKRLYGPIAAIGATGAFLGAVAAGALLYVVSVEYLLPVAAAFYLIGGLLLTQEYDPDAGSLAEPRRRSASLPPPVTGPVRLRDHPYVAQLAAISVLTTAAALVSDYLFKVNAAVALAPSELPGFFARYNGAVSIISLALQAVGASWLLRKGGVLGVFMLLPLALLVGGATTMFTASAFFAIVLTKGADATLRNSVHRVAGELLWMPVAVDVRAAVREPLESVVARLVQAATAAVLLGVSLLGFASPTVMAAILVGLAASWLTLAASLRKPYLAQLRSALTRPTFGADQELDLPSIEVVVEALSSVDERRVIAAVQVLRAHHRSRLIPALLLRHDSPEVLAAALDAIAVPGRTDWVPLTYRLLEADHPLIRISAVRALARAGERRAIETGLADQDPVVRASAMFWDAHTTTAADPATLPVIAALIDGDDDDSDTIRRILAEAIRDDGDARWASVLLALAQLNDPALIEPLAGAVKRIPDVRYLPILIERLANRAGRKHVRPALLAIGEPALAALEQALIDPATPPRVRLHLPTTIALFGTQRAGDLLIARLREERSGAVRYRLLRAIARLAIRQGARFELTILVDELRHHIREHFRLLGLAVAFGAGDHRPSAELVRGLLQDKVSQARDRVFLVLEALHPRDDVRSIERAFESSDRAARAHAFEFLDTLTRHPLYAEDHAKGIRDGILAAYEDLSPADQVARVPELARAPLGSFDALDRMLHDSDSLLAACAAYHALQLGPSRLAERVIAISQERPLLAPLGLAEATSA